MRLVDEPKPGKIQSGECKHFDSTVTKDCHAVMMVCLLYVLLSKSKPLAGLSRCQYYSESHAQ